MPVEKSLGDRIHDFFFGAPAPPPTLREKAEAFAKKGLEKGEALLEKGEALAKKGLEKGEALGKEVAHDVALAYYAEHKQWQIYVAGILFFAGLVHFIPGPTQGLQAKMLGMPSWMLFCAGILMMGSGAYYHYHPVEGLYGVSLCMGGAMMTGALLPVPMLKPMSVVSSLLFLSVAIWANHHKEGKLDKIEAILFLVAFVVGALGRLLCPKCNCLLLLLEKIKVLNIVSQAKLNEKEIKSQCPSCGNFYASDSKFCRKCGRMRDHVYTFIEKNTYVKGQLAEEGATAPSSTPAPTPASTPAADEKKGEDTVRKRGRVETPRG